MVFTPQEPGGEGKNCKLDLHEEHGLHRTNSTTISDFWGAFWRPYLSVLFIDGDKMSLLVEGWRCGQG